MLSFVASVNPAFLMQLRADIAPFARVNDEMHQSKTWVGVDRNSITFIPQNILSIDNFDQGHTIAHQCRHTRNSRVNPVDGTAIEHDRSDLRTCRVSKQRHLLASCWRSIFCLERRQVAASVASSISLVFIVPNFSAGSRKQIVL